MRHALVLLMFLGMACAARAQSAPLADPTRPPIVEPERMPDAAAKPAGPQLQSVLISPSRRVAVVDGSPLTVGARLGDATVVAISEGAVVLRHANRKETTLQLLPGVEKRERGAAPREEGNPR